MFNCVIDNYAEFKIIMRSLKCRILAGREHAVHTPESNHCLNLRSNFHVEFVTEKTRNGQFAKEIL